MQPTNLVSNVNFAEQTWTLILYYCQRHKGTEDEPPIQQRNCLSITSMKEAPSVMGHSKRRQQQRKPIHGANFKNLMKKTKTNNMETRDATTIAMYEIIAVI